MSSPTPKNGHTSSQGDVNFYLQRADHKDCFDEEGHVSPSATKLRVSSTRVASDSNAPKIPLPPSHGLAFQPPPRSVSMIKRLWKPVEDPFVAAFRECAKSSSKAKNSDDNKETRVVSLVKRSMSVFSCKDGCEIKEDSMVRLPRLPPIPREKLTYGFKTFKVSPP